VNGDSSRLTGPLALIDEETRVLGCLLEKQRTTPDQYPLTLNALRLACNQSTNRDPVLELDDAIIRDALHRLERRGLIRLASGRGSRAPKYRHLLADALPMRPEEQAIMCVLMLRGPQTPGELKQRTERMHSFAGLAEVGETLERLIARGLAQRLDRRPGHKEERYRELLTEDAAHAHARAGMRAADGAESPASTVDGSVAATDGAASVTSAEDALGAPRPSALQELSARVERLEREVAALRAEQTHADAAAQAGVSAGERSGWGGE
jgi:uncharacterized protein YceH (UPF0502 family)